MGKSGKSTIRKFEFYETITDNGIESGYVRLANTQFPVSYTHLDVYKRQKYIFASSMPLLIYLCSALASNAMEAPLFSW